MGKRILVVEDSTMMRRVIVKVLKEAGHDKPYSGVQSMPDLAGLDF